MSAASMRRWYSAPVGWIMLASLSRTGGCRAPRRLDERQRRQTGSAAVAKSMKAAILSSISGGSSGIGGDQLL